MKKIGVFLNSTPPLLFPLDKYGYTLGKILNNENRWPTKVVCSILDNDYRRYVSTTYAKQNDYFKLLEVTTYLKCNNKLSPKIDRLYPKDKTVVCHYTGEFLHDYLLKNSAGISCGLSLVFDYLKDINSINQNRSPFVTPPIIKSALELGRELNNNFEFLPKLKTILPKLTDLEVKFTYGCGIEDPHIWNFRIVKTRDSIQALTTDFDYFSDRVNYFWELGYFYATLRWLKRIAFPLAGRSEDILFSLIQDKVDLKSEFMFWLGVLSSYCGYKDSLINLMMSNGMDKLWGEYQQIQQLDEKVFSLAGKILLESGYIEHNALDEAPAILQ